MPERRERRLVAELSLGAKVREMSFLIAEERIRDVRESERRGNQRAEWMAMLRALGLVACLLLAWIALGVV